MAFGGEYRDGVRAGLPLALPVFVVGVSFGALAESAGWGVLAPVVCSLVIVSASAQFAMASVLGAGGGPGAAVLAASLVSGRFLPMGIAVAKALRGGRARRALEAQAIVDSSWALAHQGDGRFDRGLLIGATVPQLVGWILGTVIGVLAGAVIGDIERLGLDVLIPAFFLVLLVPELRSRAALAAASLASAMTLGLMPVAPAGVPVLVASVAALIGLRSR